MADGKRSILVSVLRKAVGLPAGTQSCCGTGVAEGQSAGGCCGGAEKPVEQVRATCCGGGAGQAGQSGSKCC